MARIVVYDRFGYPLGEIHATCKRSWKTNDYGTAQFYAIEDELTVDMMQFGNMILIEHEKLPPWLGMIEPDLDQGDVWAINALSGEVLLAIRTPYWFYKDTGTAGAMIWNLARGANMQEEMLLREGAIDWGGQLREEIWDLRAYLEHCRTIAKAAGLHFWITPHLEADNRLIHHVNVQQRRGVDTGFLLESGWNIVKKDKGLSYTGYIWNAITGISDPTTGAGATRLSYFQRDDESAAKYRLRTKSFQYNGVTSQATITQNVKEDLERYRDPVETYNVSALDVGDTWNNLDVDNTALLRVNKGWSAEGDLRTLALVVIRDMTFDEAAGVVDLKMDVVERYV